LLPRRFFIATLGCKVNQYESESVREAWLRAGHQELGSPMGADLALVNSCAVTARAVGDLRALIRRIRRQAPECELVVTGCAAQALPEELRLLPVDELVGRGEEARLLERLPSLREEAAVVSSAGDLRAAVRDLLDAVPGAVSSRTDLWAEADGAAEEAGISRPDSAPGSFPPFSLSGHARSRALLKIQDGCSRHCAYCIVPQGRGPASSRPWPAVLAEADRLIRAGFREIVLNGVNLGDYEDLWTLTLRLGKSFADLLDFGEGPRFRLSSLDPGQLGPKALEALSVSPWIAPHLHLSLQSGSPRLLRRMGRGHYDPAAVPGFLEELRKVWPLFGLGADFIVGFPGESEADFAATLELAQVLPLSYAHVFPFSGRPGTPAARFRDQLPPELKKERAMCLRRLVAAKKAAFLRAQLDLPIVRVALEEGRPDRGVNEFYSLCRFTGQSRKDQAGKVLIPARPVRARGEILLVEGV